jgi:hypothetical protein
MADNTPKLSFFPQSRDEDSEAQLHKRWDVKTGADPEANKIHRTPRPTTIAHLSSANAPAKPPSAGRIEPTETTIWELVAESSTLIGYKFERDQDYHLVLADGESRTMIVEIPDPSLLESSNPFQADITASRQAFDARFGTQMRALEQLLRTQPPEMSAPMLVQIAVPIHVMGIGFFDFAHGQEGAAPNGIELHPVLSIEFG